ncbi:MAG: polyphosphate kinase 2, partial [Cyanobacteria bacterium]|nr:polyphosphate kinase 2 [Cyanobacteria bacterium bin.51]
AGVEKVMGFCTPQEHALFLRQVPGFEQSLVSSGILLFKMWFTVSQARQKGRFDNRRKDPLKQWKLSPIDEVSVEKYSAYTEARNEMLLATDTLAAPWTIVNSNEKKRARLGAIRSVLHALDYAHKDHDVACEPDPRVVRTAHSVFINN